MNIFFNINIYTLIMFFNRHVFSIFISVYCVCSVKCGCCKDCCCCNVNKDQLNFFNDNNQKILTKDKNPGFKKSVKELESLKTKESIIPEQTYPKIDIEDKNLKDVEKSKGVLDNRFNDLWEFKRKGEMTKFDDKKNNSKEKNKEKGTNDGSEKSINNNDKNNDKYNKDNKDNKKNNVDNNKVGIEPVNLNTDVDNKDEIENNEVELMTNNCGTNDIIVVESKDYYSIGGKKLFILESKQPYIVYGFFKRNTYICKFNDFSYKKSYQITIKDDDIKRSSYIIAIVEVMNYEKRKECYLVLNFNYKPEHNYGLFCRCENITKIIILKTGNIANMSHMFRECSSLTTVIFNNINTINLTDMSSMFQCCSALIAVNFNNINTSNVKYMGNMFYGCKSLTTINFNNMDTSNVTNMSDMFSGCSSLKELNINNFNTSNVTNMDGMFYGCTLLKELHINNFNTKNVIDMSMMFYGCSSLKELDLTNFITDNVTKMSNMFNRCLSLENLNLEKFNTEKVIEMYRMFYECSSLTNINFSNWNTSSVGNMSHMFYGCSSLKKLDLTSFYTPNVIDMSGMFLDCILLEELKVGHLLFYDGSKTKTESMFGNTKNLRRVICAEEGKYEQLRQALEDGKYKYEYSNLVYTI